MKKGLPPDGNKKDLVGRLEALRAGGGERPGQLLCRVCRRRAKVVSTQRKENTIVRYVECTGRHRHRYKLTEQIGASAAAEAWKVAEND